MLFHVSEEPGIERFEPRTPEGGGQAVVWAIDDEHLRNYLVPRDCPRVTFYAGRDTTADDRARFLGSNLAVLAIERGWYDRLRSCRLCCYALAADSFTCVDACAGYFVSRHAVSPMGVHIVGDPVGELRRREVELRVLPDLWDLRDAVAASTLQFSLIRMRNALPRAGSDNLPQRG